MKQALALLINDIHCSKDNIAEFNKNWDEAIKVALDNNVEDIVVGGDMFTAQASQTLPVLLAVKRALDRAVEEGLYVTLANGNHDKADRESIDGYCHIFQGQSNIEVVNEYAVLDWVGADKMLVLWAYFPEDGSFTERLERGIADILQNHENIDSKSDIILYLHEGIKGALGMEVPGELPVEMFADYHAVLCGHYHNRIHIPDTNIWYVGSSRQNNFGEDPEKGYTLLYDDGTWGYIENKVNTRYLTYDIDGKNADAFSFEPKEGYKYRLKVNCTDRQAKDFDKQKFLDMGFSKVEVKSTVEKPKEIAVSGIEEKYDSASIKKEYQDFCNEKDIDATLGIAYLNKIN